VRGGFAIVKVVLYNMSNYSRILIGSFDQFEDRRINDVINIVSLKSKEYDLRTFSCLTIKHIKIHIPVRLSVYRRCQRDSELIASDNDLMAVLSAGNH